MRGVCAGMFRKGLEQVGGVSEVFVGGWATREVLGIVWTLVVVLGMC